MIRFDLVQGWPSLGVEQLRKRIDQLSVEADFPQKVGITNEPSRRLREYSASKGWRRMTVLYRSGSLEHLKTLKQQVVRWFPNSRVAGCYRNVAAGGQGRPALGGPFFLHVVGSPRCSRLNT